MRIGRLEFSKKAQQEIADWKLGDNAEYCNALAYYKNRYDSHPPVKTTPTKNMLKALRMLQWHNTPDDWARLHMTELYLSKHK